MFVYENISFSDHCGLKFMNSSSFYCTFMYDFKYTATAAIHIYYIWASCRFVPVRPVSYGQLILLEGFSMKYKSCVIVTNIYYVTLKWNYAVSVLSAIQKTWKYFLIFIKSTFTKHWQAYLFYRFLSLW